MEQLFIYIILIHTKFIKFYRFSRYIGYFSDRKPVSQTYFYLQKSNQQTIHYKWQYYIVNLVCPGFNYGRYKYRKVNPYQIIFRQVFKT